MRPEIETVIIAGGKGSRMGELTKDTQKCMLDFDGKPALARIFDNIIDGFGSGNVVIALGYKGEQVAQYFGKRYGTLSLSYVINPDHLETKRRLLLAENEIQSRGFLFLAGDILCKPSQLLAVAERYECEQKYSMGVLSAASYHDPAKTHGLVQIEDGEAKKIIFPPTDDFSKNQFREMHVAYYGPEFWELLKQAPEKVIHISRVLSQAIDDKVPFLGSVYPYHWYHFVESKDLNQAYDPTYTRVDSK